MLIIGMTCYNTEKYIAKAIESVKLQKEQKWKCYITNDLSTDNSVDVINKHIGDDKRFVLINNTTKHWQAGNYWQICHHKDVKEKDIFVELDSDDWFADADVLTRVKEYYKDPNVWLSFGSFKYADGRMGFARPPVGGIHNQRISHAFTTSHLRAFRVSLFRKLELADICEDDGTTFIPFSGDLFFFQCMLELCGDEHYKFCTDINYVYNDNDGSEHIVGMDKVIHYTNMAKTRPPKNVLESL